MSGKNNRIRNFFCLLCLVSYSYIANAQEANPHDFAKVTDVLSPAPNAAALAKYGGIEVSLNTGMVNKSLTLYTFKSSNITVPITLTYSSGGFKVDDQPSRAGFGWALNAGGVITRTVVGEMDEGYMRKLPPATITTDSISFDYLSKTAEGDWDSEPDVYSFNFNGYSGKFVYDENGEIICLPANNLKIEKNTGNTDWNFKVIAPDGLMYFFGGNTATEKTKKEGGCGKPYEAYVPTAWYLNKIKTPLGDSVLLNYQSLLYAYSSPLSQNIYRNGITNSINCSNTDGSTQTCTDYQSQSAICGGASRTQGVLLTEITTTNAGKVQFTYTSFSGYDDQFYSAIVVKDFTGKVCYNFALEYQQVSTTLYLNSFSTSTLRPFLKKLKEQSSDLALTKEYGFSYNKLDSLPVVHTYSVDHWGFFNGTANSSIVEKPDDFYLQADYPGATANREPNSQFAALGLLSKIEYPTGGYDTIIYEGNDFYGYKQIKPTLTSLQVSATGTGAWTPVTVNSSQLPVAFQHSVKLQYTFVDNTGNGSYDPVHNKGTVTVTNVTTSQVVFEMVAVPDNIQRTQILNFNINDTYLVSATANGTAVTTNINLQYRPGSAIDFYGNITIGGVRVKQVTSYATGTSVATTKKYSYCKSLDSLNYSSGGTPGVPVYIREFKSRFACYNLSVSPPQCNEVYCYYGAMQSVSLTNMNIYPSGVTYGTVIESEGENFANGAIEHRYTIKSDQGAINLNAALEGDLIPGRSYFNDSYFNGYELRNKVYRKNESAQLVPVEMTEYRYKIDERRTKDVKGAIVQKRYDFCLGFLNAPTTSMIDAFNINLYAHQSRWIYADTIIKTSFDPSGQATIVTTNYLFYDNADHMQVTCSETSTSTGEVTGTVTKYPGDFGTLTGTDAITLGVKNLQELYAQSVAVETVSYRRQTGSSTRRVVSATFSAYKTATPLPDVIYQVETRVPITDFNYAIEQSGSVVKDTRYKSQVAFTSYDLRGNLLGQQKINDLPFSYLWDYQSAYPVAQASNAIQADIAYTSFEAEGSGNWSIVSSLRTTDGITGNKCYQLSNGDITRNNLNASTVYIITYWTNGSALNISGTQGSVVQGRSVGDWKCFMHQVTGVSQLTISGTGLIDELRLYPQGAQMITNTYDPLIGITSQCDVANKIVYYEYDSFGRLKLIRDQDKNILRTFDYQYQQNTNQ